MLRSAFEGLREHIDVHHKRAAVMAICAVEMAMWDAFGKACGQPLHRLWGGLWRDKVKSPRTFSPTIPRRWPRRRAFQDRGFSTFKLKIGYDEATDISRTRAVREAIGPMRRCAWTSTVRGHRAPRAGSAPSSCRSIPRTWNSRSRWTTWRATRCCAGRPTVPIALDESAYTLNDIGNIVRIEAADVILLDPHEEGACGNA